ncbi:MAG: metal ABC transporter solute-binding protein, Zn/Mn family [Sphaerochaeta sp.]
MKKIILLTMAIAASIASVFASGSSEAQSKPLIAVSILPEQTFVEKVVGDKMDIITLVGKGASPENYELTPKERAQFESSKLYFTIGVPTEDLTILPYVNKDTQIISLQDRVDEVYAPIMMGPTRNPHIWLSPKRAILMVTEIADEVSKLDEKNKDYYMANAKSYIKELEQLDEYLASYFSDLDRREFIVYHPAFDYFAEDYNLKVDIIEIEGKETTAKELAALIENAKKVGIKNVFYQAEIADSQSATIAKELGGRAIQLDPLSPDYIENLKETAKLIKENI